MKGDYSNVVQTTRNEMLAKLIDNGCQNLEHLKAVAKTAQLDEKVTLDSDKSVEEYRKWWFFKEHKLVVTPKNPLERARVQGNQGAVNVLQELKESKQPQKLEKTSLTKIMQNLKRKMGKSMPPVLASKSRPFSKDELAKTQKNPFEHTTVAEVLQEKRAERTEKEFIRANLDKVMKDS